MAAVMEPKKPMTSYFLFIQDNRENVQKELATKDFGPVTKALTERWKNISASNKANFDKKAGDLKVQYQKDLAAFKEAGGVAGQKRKDNKDLKAAKAAKRAKKESEADKPKRPAGGAYGCFMAANRAEMSKSLPAGSPVTAVAKIAGERFKALSAKDKAKYEAEYQAKKTKYEEEMKAWKATKGASDDGAEDEDEEDDEDKEN